MAKTRDEIYVELYDSEDVRMVTECLKAKLRRENDRERKDRDNKEHLRKVWERRMERWCA